MHPRSHCMGHAEIPCFRRGPAVGRPVSVAQNSIYHVALGSPTGECLWLRSTGSLSLQTREVVLLAERNIRKYCTRYVGTSCALRSCIPRNIARAREKLIDLSLCVVLRTQLCTARPYGCLLAQHMEKCTQDVARPSPNPHHAHSSLGLKLGAYIRRFFEQLTTSPGHPERNQTRMEKNHIMDSRPAVNTHSETFSRVNQV